METRVLPATHENVLEAARVLLSGGLVAFPTETVYGLGANALDQAAVTRIFAAKGRPADNPLIVHVFDYEMARSLGDVPDELANAFWPGPLTLVVARSPVVPSVLAAGGETVGIRSPAHPVALDLIRTAGVPIAAPSANRSRAVSPVTAQHVLDDLRGRIEIVLDGGRTPGGMESTVLDVTERPYRVLRLGALAVAEIEAVVGEVEIGGVLGRSPGQLGKHYATRTRLYLAEGDGGRLVSSLRDEGMRVGWMPVGEREMERVEVRGMPFSAKEYEAALYATLRDLDALGLDAIVVEKPPREPEWAAVLDRLERAATEE